MGRTSDARERLIEAAIRLIYTRSYGAVGVQEICEHAEVKKGSFYHFFPSKRDLTLAATDELGKRLHQRLLGPAFADDIPPLERITRFFDLSAELQETFKRTTGHVLGCPLGNLALEMSTQDEVLRERIGAQFRAAESHIEKTLWKAKHDGAVPDIEPASAARAIFAYMEGLLLMAKARNEPDCIRELGRAAVALVYTAAVEEIKETES